MPSNQRIGTAATRLKPRKDPRQQRSKMTVNSIRQATLELAGKSGFATLTTAAIAGRAGVSIGTFYDYFPNKNALLLGIFETISAELVADMRTLMANVLDAAAEEAVEMAIRKLLALHDKYKLVLIDMVSEMPELHLRLHPLAFDSLGRGSIHIFLEHRGKRMSADELECRVFFVQQVLNSSIREYLSHYHQRISKRDFIANLTAIMAPYIKSITAPGRLTKKRNPAALVVA